MGTLDDYKKAREQLEALYTEVMQGFNPLALSKGARLLDLNHKGNLAFQSEEQASALFELLCYEPVFDGSSGIEQYLQNHMDVAPRQRELLEQMAGTPASLYRVLRSFPDTSEITVQDILRPAEPEITVTDIHMSHGHYEDTVLFTRILQFPEVAMTAGLVMPFPEKLESFLLRKSKMLQKHRRDSHAGLGRFLAYYQLYRQFGMPAHYAAAPDSQQAPLNSTP